MQGRKDAVYCYLTEVFGVKEEVHLISVGKLQGEFFQIADTLLRFEWLFCSSLKKKKNPQQMFLQ